MKRAQNAPRRLHAWSAVAIVVPFARRCRVLVAQQNSAQPQPQADKLPAPGNRESKAEPAAPRPEGAMPSVPAGLRSASTPSYRRRA